MELYLEHIAKSMSSITETIRTLKKTNLPEDRFNIDHLQNIHKNLTTLCKEIGEDRHKLFSGGYHEDWQRSRGRREVSKPPVICDAEYPELSKEK